MARVAFMTTGVLHAPGDDPRVQGFVDRTDAVFALAESGDGFLGRDIPVGTTGERSWGDWAAPAIFQKEADAGRMAQTLSLWRDLESVSAFAYNGLHAEALSKRKEWFVTPAWSSYVAWWVDDDHTPSWQEACERFDRLHREGSTSVAFNFKQPFDSNGQVVELDRASIKRMAAQYRTKS